MSTRLPHWLAWLLVLATFPLVWMGGLVTTYGAGMAVPDWPRTFGWWWYPVRSWLVVWDVFLEHGHRVIAMSVGLVTIALAVALWLGDRRKGIRWLGLAAIVGVCFQGTLGGLRVIGNEIILADVHGCTAPLFFSLGAALVVLTSSRWLAASPGTAVWHCLPAEKTRTIGESSLRRASSGTREGATRYQRLALVMAVLVYVQIVLGAQLRHRLPGAALYWFQLWVWLHLASAALQGALLVALVRSPARQGQPMLRRRAWLVAVLYLVQLALGVLTWITHYGLPGWFRDYLWTIDYTVVTKGRLQALSTTGHVAAGSLALVVALSLALWSRRLLAEKT